MTSFRVLSLLAASVASLAASSTATWELHNYQDFLRGRFDRLSLTREGRIVPAPRLDSVFDSGQPAVWAVAAAPDGTMYAATGHKGRVYRIPKSGPPSIVWSADQPEIFALAAAPDGAIYAASSPNGKIVRIASGKVEDFFVPKTTYIWTLAVGRDGALYAGTGEGGKIFRVTAAGKGEVWYETGQGHVTALAIDAQGRLLAGTEPNGILYRITGKEQAFALFDANLPEIRAIVPQADGTIYAAALGGSVARRSSAAQQAVQPGAVPGAATPVTTVTITADAAAQPAAIEPKPTPEPAKPAQPTTPATQVTSSITPVMDVAGVEKSALYRIRSDNTYETLWSSKEENAYDLLVRQGDLWFATDASGRVYRLSPDQKVTLVVQTNEGEATRLLPDGATALVATGNAGRIYRLGDAPAGGGVYESPIHDAGTVARWGRLDWRGDGQLTLLTRSGNSLRPDKTWSEWSAAVSTPGQVPSPNARYLQWKAGIPSGAALDSVTVSYLPQNTPPQVKSITVLTQLAAAAQGAKPAAQSAATAMTVTVSDVVDPSASPSAGTPTTALTRPANVQIAVTWQAEDPDGDKLTYALWYRGEEEREWKRLRTHLHDNTFTLEGDTLADGRYYFKVVASDSETNSPEAARDAELVSNAILVDNTPPALVAGPVKRSGPTAELEVTAADATSPLRRCEYAIDAGPWHGAAAADGVIDSQQERFPLRLDNLAPGEHVLVIRAMDSAGNTGLLKVILP